MKKITLILLFFISTTMNSQELKRNSDTGKFEYIVVVDGNRKVGSIEQRLKDLNYSDITNSTKEITGRSQINEQVMGFVVELFYTATIEFKDDKYRIKISNVNVKDTKGNYVLEDMGTYQKKWLKKFNNRLPEIVEKLKTDSQKSEW